MNMSREFSAGTIVFEIFEFLSSVHQRIFEVSQIVDETDEKKHEVRINIGL